MNTELDKIAVWFKVNMLSLNILKTNYMLFGNKLCDKEYQIEIEGNLIEKVDNTKFVGVYLDDKFS